MENLPASRDIHREIVELCEQGRRFAVLLVLKAAGSTPGRTAGRAIVHDDGVLSGTIGGGMVEAESRRRALESLDTCRTQVLEFEMAGEIVAGDAPICGGTMRVLVDPEPHRHREAYLAALAARDQREAGVMVTRIQGPDPWRVQVKFFAEDRLPGASTFPAGDTLRLALERDQPMHVISDAAPATERWEALVEPVRARPLLVIAGGGHVGQAVALQADLVGFEVLVIDDRPEFTRPERFPDRVSARCGQIADEIARLPFGRDTYVVLVTRGHQGDAEALAACLNKPTTYIGMIGSRRKVSQMRNEFVRSGRTSSADFDRVYAPIGLDLGAVTVPEIATSIVAQLIAVRRKGTAERIRSR